MGKVKLSFEAKSGANMLVTGNPGTGKSRFYLYCIFHLLGHQEEVKELTSFDLVLNSKDFFYIYEAESSEFMELSTEQIRAVSQ
jgi:predicted ATPase with chaperone activity